MYFKRQNESAVIIGGPGVEIEVDETVLCRRGVVRNPTTFDDDFADTVWIIGIIDKNDKSNFLVKRIPNKRIETITSVLERMIGVGSVLVSDGYPSHPGVASNLSLTHNVVNHTEDLQTKKVITPIKSKIFDPR